MIRNYDQYRKAKAKVRRLEQALAQLDAGRQTRNTRATRDAYVAQIEDTREELVAFEAVEQGQAPEPEPAGLARLPDMLVRARIASRLTQRQLGERVGLHENQIQQYERSGYQSASLRRLQDVAAAMDLDFEVLLRYNTATRGSSSKEARPARPPKARALESGA